MSDYIEREAAINAVNQRCAESGHPMMFSLKNPLLSIPAADVVPVVHGRWKPYDLTWGRSVYACTACEEAFEVPTDMGKPIYAYCPNCGAKMDKEGDEE